MKILITGATGLIGKVLVDQLLTQNHSIHYLTTQKKIDKSVNPKGFYWNPALGEIDKTAFEGVEAIIHLAGATIAKPWTPSYRKEILTSRILTAQLIEQTLKKRKQKIAVFIGASATGIYPSSFTAEYHENVQADGDDFLGTVVQQWEAAADPLKSHATRWVLFRIGLVLSNKGGVLPTMALPIRWGIGGPLGSGNQWQSWIHIEDLCALFTSALNAPFTGIYNAVAPEAVTQKKLLKTLAQQLHRPLFFPSVPAFVLKMILGARSSLVLNSQKVISARLPSTGFQFTYPNIQSALRQLYE